MTPGTSATNKKSHGDEELFSPEQLRELFHRKTMAGERHRTTAARLLGMDGTEAAALAHLAQHGQLSPGELGALVGLTSGGTTSLIERLITSGHLHRHPHPHDKRSSLLTASRAVIERAEALYAPLVHETDQLAAELTDAHRAVIGCYLTRVAELSERHAQQLADSVRAKERMIISPPARGLWT
jgi:DNA-binding MarR family transcriptional regulator